MDDAVKDTLSSINLITNFRHSKDWPKIESKLRLHNRSNIEIAWRKQKHRSRIFNRLYKEQSNNIFNLVDMAVETKLKETFIGENYFSEFVDIKKEIKEIVGDLISRKALIEKIKRNGEICPNVPWVTAYALALAEEAPSVELKRGEWVETIKDGRLCRTTTCCNDDQTVLTMWCRPKFCPNCGADMR